MIPRVTASVDLGAIAHNLRQIRAFAPRSKVMAAVKAGAYGHGAVPVARRLSDAGVDALAVACMEEAQQLREAHVTVPIALLEGVISTDEAALAAYEGLQIVVHEPWQLELLEAMPRSASLRVWFKIDTGMHRLGFSPTAVPMLRDTLRRHPGWQFCGWMTHLACADEPDNPMTLRQIDLFDGALEGAAGARSIGNSAGILGWPEARRDWVRPGLMLYGATPMPEQTGHDVGLKPALSLDSRLIAIHEVAAGETIGYGASFRCPVPMRIGVVAVGYADGVHRCTPTGTPVLVRQQRVPMVGRVSMDMLTVDLSAVPDAQVGDPVRLWGEGLPAAEIARHAGTLAYELFCGLTNRVHFRYRD